MVALVLSSEAREFGDFDGDRTSRERSSCSRDYVTLEQGAEMLASSIEGAVHEAVDRNKRSEHIRLWPQQALVKASLGAGKSHVAWSSVAGIILEVPHFRILIRAQSHAMAKQIEDDINKCLRDLGAKPARYPRVHRWVGAESADPRAGKDEEVAACQNMAAVRDTRRAGGSISDVCLECPLKDVCFYRSQDAATHANVVIVAGDATLSKLPAAINRHENDHHAAELNALKREQLRGPVVVDNEYKLAKEGMEASEEEDEWIISPNETHFDLVIIDETKVPDLVKQDQGKDIDIDVLVADLGRMHDDARIAAGITDEKKVFWYGAGFKQQEDLRALRSHLEAVARGEGSFVSAYETVSQRMGLDVEGIKALMAWVLSAKVSISKELRAVLHDEGIRVESLAPLASLNSTIRDICKILGALIEAARDARREERYDIYREAYQLHPYVVPAKDGDSETIRVSVWRRSGIDAKIINTPTLIIDATADIEALRQWWPHLRLAGEINIEDGEGVFRCQLSNSVMSKASQGMGADPKSKGHAKQKVNAGRLIVLDKLREMQTGGAGGMVTIKATKDFLKEECGVSNERLLNYGNCRGQNNLEDAPHLIVAGRVVPGVKTLERLAGVIFGMAVVRHDQGFLPKNPEAVITHRDGYPEPSTDEHHPDHYVDRVRRMVANDEIKQAIGRGRSIRRTKENPIVETVVTSTDCGHLVDATFTRTEYHAATGWVGALLSEGIWPVGNGSNLLRVFGLRSFMARSPTPAECFDFSLEDRDDDSARAFIGSLVRNREQTGVLCDAITEAIINGGGCKVLCVETDLSGWHRLKIKIGDKRAAISYVRGDTVEEAIDHASTVFEGAKIAHDPIKNGSGCDQFDDTTLSSLSGASGSKSWDSGIYIDSSQIPTLSDGHAPLSDDQVEQCFADLGFLPLNGRHACELGPWGSKSQANRVVNEYTRQSGDLEVQYKWTPPGASRGQRARGYVRVSSVEEAQEIMRAHMPGIEFLDKGA